MPPRSEERIAEPQADAQARPVPVPAVPGVPHAAPRVRIAPTDVAGRRRDGVGRDVEIEVVSGRLHPLDEVHQAGFGIGSYTWAVERVVVPTPVLFELVEPERRLGERGEHRSMAGRVVGDERFAASAPLQLVLLAGA